MVIVEKIAESEECNHACNICAKSFHFATSRNDGLGDRSAHAGRAPANWFSNDRDSKPTEK